MFYNLGRIGNKYAILDTEDLVTDLLTLEECRYYISLGFKIDKFEKSSVVLKTSGNRFEISIFDSNRVLYRGKFPTSNDRGDFFDMSIHINNVVRFKNSILVEVTASVWCKYDIEVPMFMFQIINLPMKDIDNTSLSVYTGMALTTANSIHEYDYMQGDCPDNCCISSEIGQNKYIEDKMVILGVEYTDISYYDDICKKVEYLED